jgi:hypothetical protein
MFLPYLGMICCLDPVLFSLWSDDKTNVDSCGGRYWFESSCTPTSSSWLPGTFPYALLAQHDMTNIDLCESRYWIEIPVGFSS